MVFLKMLGICVFVASLTSCRKKSEAVAKEIREAGYEMTADGWFSAVEANDVAAMKKMVAGGFDEKTKNSDDNSGLHLAAKDGNREAAEYLLNRGFNIDTPGAGGRTPLMMAVVSDQPAMVKWLLRQGADPKLKDSDGFMPLMLAVKTGGKLAVEELAPYHREDLDSALLVASLMGKADVIDSLTNYGASVYATMEDGRTPLMLAAQNGHMQAAALLIDIGASRFATTDSGETAQSFAVAGGHNDLAEMIESGFTGGLTLESEEEVAEAMEEYVEEAQAASEDGLVAIEGEENQTGNHSLASDSVPRGPDPARGGTETTTNTADSSSRGGPASAASVSGKMAASSPVLSLEGAQVSRKSVARSENSASAGSPVMNREVAGEGTDELPLVMRHYRQRELPLEVKQVSGGVASLRLAGPTSREVDVAVGEVIPESDLVVVKVFTRMEQGKLNNSQPIEVGIVEVEDRSSGRKREWIVGQSASGHDPVALVEDAVTGQRYLAKPGQKFRSEDGREFLVNDVRPSQLVIEEIGTGQVRTLRLRGPKG